MKHLKTIADFLIVAIVLTVFLSIGMGYWMNEAPMHHGDHECCDFIPMQTSTAPSASVLFSPLLIAVALVIWTFVFKQIKKQSQLVPSIVPPHHRKFLKGVVQRE